MTTEYNSAGLPRMTGRVQAIFNFLVSKYDEFPAPSIREIGRAVNVESTSLTAYYLSELERLGLLEVVRDEHGVRLPRGTRIKPSLIAELRTK